MSEETDRTTKLVAENFSTFGGGKANEWNPVSIALAKQPVMFAAGVDVKSVVKFVLDNLPAPAIQVEKE